MGQNKRERERVQDVCLCGLVCVCVVCVCVCTFKTEKEIGVCVFVQSIHCVFEYVSMSMYAYAFILYRVRLCYFCVIFYCLYYFQGQTCIITFRAANEPAGNNVTLKKIGNKLNTKKTTSNPCMSRGCYSHIWLLFHK